MLLVKVGGGKKIKWSYTAKDLAEMAKTRRVIIIHGANETRDAIAQKMGHPTKVITAPSGVESVYTNKEAIDSMLMAYAGLVNKRIVATLQSYGINALGLSGIDGRVLEGKWKKNLYAKEGKKTRLVSDSFTGRVEQVNTRLLKGLLNTGYTPVLCPPAISYEDMIINCDNDWTAAVVAGSIGVKEIISLFEAPGFLRDSRNEESVISRIKKEELDKYMEFAEGRMKKKLLGAQKAFSLGVRKIYFGDGRIKKPITNALAGRGTVLS